jgi:hypothetical protein
MLPSRALHRYLLVRRDPHRFLFIPFALPLLLKFCSGLNRYPAGRLNENPSYGLSASLRNAGFRLGRLQTGTPARLDASSIDFSRMARQDGDTIPRAFGFMGDGSVRCKVRKSGVLWRRRRSLTGGMWASMQDNQASCWQTFTTPETHRFIRENMHLSVHIQETKKGMSLLPSSPYGAVANLSSDWLFRGLQARDIAPPSKRKSYASKTRRLTSFGWNRRVMTRVRYSFVCACECKRLT